MHITPEQSKSNSTQKQNICLKHRLVKGAIGSFGLKIISTGLAFSLNLLIARAMGSEGLGLYALAISWLGLLGLLAKMGLPQLMVRNVAIYTDKREWPLLGGLLLRSYQLSLTFSVLLAIAAGVSVHYLQQNLQQEQQISQIFPVMLLAFAALPLSTLRKLNQGVMNGFQEVVKSQLPESLIAPLLMFGLVASAYLFSESNIAPITVMGFYVGSLALSTLIGLHQIGQMLPSELLEVTPEYSTKAWLQAAVPFMAFGALAMVSTQTDVIMLGALKGSESVGLYVVANRLASLIIFVLATSDAVLSPSIASFYAAGKMRQLKEIVKKSSRIVLPFSIAITAFIVVFRNALLSLFGPEFLAGGNALTVLAIGQTINAFAGPCGPLLNMTGYERLAIVAFGISSVANVGLNAYLIPLYSIEGAAIATTISMALWNIICWALVMKHLGINSTALGQVKG